MKGMYVDIYEAKGIADLNSAGDTPRHPGWINLDDIMAMVSRLENTEIFFRNGYCLLVRVPLEKIAVAIEGPIRANRSFQVVPAIQNAAISA